MSTRADPRLIIVTIAATVSSQYRSRASGRGLSKVRALTALTLICGARLAKPLAAAPSPPPKAATDLTLAPCRVMGVKEEVRCGVYKVFENRQTRKGRMLPLKIVVIPAKHPHPADGPIFYMAGGPGETATELADFIIESGDSDEHDVVLVDERGTGDGHRLDCRSPGSDNNLESYLNGPFDPAAARACRDELEHGWRKTSSGTALSCSLSPGGFNSHTSAATRAMPT